MSEKVRVQTVCLQFASAFIESIKVSYYNEQFMQKKKISCYTGLLKTILSEFIISVFFLLRVLELYQKL